MFIPTDSDLPSWFKKRSYLHFDSKVSLDKTKEIVLNPKAVSSHAFYPFIKYSVISEKVSKDQKTNKISIKKKLEMWHILLIWIVIYIHIIQKC